MRIIRYYLLKEMIAPFFLSLGVLTCVFLLGNLIKMTNLVINKGVGLTTVGRVFVLYIPVLLGYTLPIACLICVILAVSRLSADNEIIALRASGIFLGRLIVPIFFVGIMLSLVSFYINTKVIPYSHHKQRSMLKTIGAENPTALLEAGMFIHSFDDQILFIHKIEDNKLFNITIYQPQEDGPTRTIIAKRGEFTPIPNDNAIKMKLIDGTSDEPNLANPGEFYKLNFENYFMTLDLGKNRNKIEKKPKSMTLDELDEQIDHLEQRFIDSVRLRTEKARKVSWSFAPLIFVLLGFPLAVITNRREKSANVTLAMIFGVVYYLLMMGCEGMAINGILPPNIVMWIPNIVGGLVAIVLNIKCVL